MKGSKNQRVRWMLDNQHLWAAWPFVNGVWNHHKDPSVEAIWKTCVGRMKADGLLSSSTRWHDVKMGIYVDTARLLLGVFN